MRKTALAGLLLLATAIWGLSFVVVKDAVDGHRYGTIAFLALRFAIGSSLLGAVGFRRFNRRSLRVGGGIGIVLALATFARRLACATRRRPTAGSSPGCSL